MIELIGYAVLGLMFTKTFEPIQRPKDRIIKLLLPLSFLHRVVDKVFNCPQCFTFWCFLIIVDQNLAKAALASFIAYILNYIHDSIENWYDL